MAWGTPELVGNPKFLEILEVKTQMSAKMILMSLPSIEIRWSDGSLHSNISIPCSRLKTQLETPSEKTHHEPQLNGDCPDLRNCVKDIIYIYILF